VVRGALLGALFLALAGASVPALAAASAGPAAFQPDVFFQQKGDEYFAGEDLYAANAVGESRSLIIDDRLVLVVKVQDDGTGACAYSIQGSPAAPGYILRYRIGRRDVTSQALAGTLVFESVRPRETRTMTVLVSVAPNAPLGADQQIVISARSTTEPGQVDAVRADITKVSDPR
jgi:hypothetical protein